VRAPRILFVPVGRSTFDQQAALSTFNASCAMLQRLGCDVALPPAVLMMPEDAEAWVRAAHAPDLVVVQFTTFVDGRFIADIAAATVAPLHLWTVLEAAANGGRLKQNSLTGINLAANTLSNGGRRFSFHIAAPDAPRSRERLLIRARAAAVYTDLRRLSIGVVGEHPPGFFNAGADEGLLLSRLGPRLEHLEIDAILAESMAMADAAPEAMAADALARVRGGDELPVVQVSRSAGIYAAVARHVAAHHYGAVALRCWPDSFERLGAAACTAISRLTDEGVPAACEADVHGAVSMWIGSQFSGEPTYLGDLVHMDTERNTCVLWHCGAAAYSLTNRRTGPAAGVHPNRKMGLTVEAGLKPGRVTILRLAPGPGGYRMLIVSGEALDEPNKFWGTSVEIRTDRPVEGVVDALIGNGFDHHYVVAYGDHRAELAALAELLGIEVVAL